MEDNKEKIGEVVLEDVLSAMKQSTLQQMLTIFMVEGTRAVVWCTVIGIALYFSGIL